MSTLDDGRQRQTIEFTVKAEAARSIVSISVSAIGDEGAHEQIPIDSLDLIWNGGTDLNAGSAIAIPDKPMSVSFTAAGRRALRIDIAAEAEDGDR